jgi:hypothetical protein
MYSGTTLTKYSGRVLGAHQKVDRVARRHLKLLLADNHDFPGIRMILHFEGKNGPDAIKRKSPAKDEPWHYFNPFKPEDTQLLDLIDDHYKQLVKELKTKNFERASFDAAWLAHALVDGLTPAHHFPYEEEVSKLRGGAPNETRTTIKEKLVMHGDTHVEKLANNWRMWGTKGLMSTHGSFEWGFSTLIAPMSFMDAVPTDKDIEHMQQIGLREYFVRVAREVAVLGLFDEYYEKGWNLKLAYKVRYKLAPILVKTITLSWYAAAAEAKGPKV